MLYAVAEIAIFMVVATIVGFLLGRVTKRSAAGLSGDHDSDLANAQTALREIEAERADLKEQLRDAKERIRLLASEATAAEKTEDFAAARRKWQEKLAAAEAQADRLRATIAERDNRIAALASGQVPEHDPALGDVGYSHSAGSFAETKIFFSEDDE